MKREQHTNVTYSGNYNFIVTIQVGEPLKHTNPALLINNDLKISTIKDNSYVPIDIKTYISKSGSKPKLHAHQKRIVSKIPQVHHRGMESINQKY